MSGDRVDAGRARVIGPSVLVIPSAGVGTMGPMAQSREQGRPTTRLADVGGGVTVRFWASVRQAAGVEEAAGFPAGTVAEVVAAVAQRFPAAAGLLPRCSVLIDAIAVRDLQGAGRERQVPDGAVVELLPPFAGG